MTGIIILCVVVFVLGALLLTPIHIQADFHQGDIAVRLRYGPLKLLLYPGRERPKEEPEEKKRPKKKTEKKETAEKKTAKKISREQILYSLEKLPPILGKALRRTGRRIRIKPLKIHLLVAGSDPADTAVLYGKLEAALEAGLPVLHRLVRIQDQDIRLYLDFQQEKMDCIADVGLSIRLWDLLVIGLGAGVGLVKWLLGFKRLAEKAPEGQAEPIQQKKDESGAA